MRTIYQLGRFGIVGLGLNAVLYGFYLVLTWWGVTPIAASSLAFVVGVPLSLFLHRTVTFRVAAVSPARKAAFVGVYAAGYVAQIGTLALLHVELQIPHPVAQAIGVVVAAAVLFVVQKRVIFRA